MERTEIRLKALASANYRRETYEGRDVLVVPVVAMVEGVVHGVNVDAPELCLAEELAKLPMGWNGRPVFYNHPQNDKGQYVSGNLPDVLAKKIGWVFNVASRNTILDEKRLTLEAWIDVLACAEHGAQEVVDRILAGDIVEISIGAFALSEKTAGEWEGKEYAAIWRDIMPDHLALLQFGDTGACSVERGCGVRALTKKEETVVAQPSLKERLLGQLASVFRANTENSDVELRNKLHNAIYAQEPGFQFIEAVFPDTNVVIYHTMPEQEWKTFTRGFTTAEDGTVALADDRQEVQLKTEYVPVGDEPKAAAAAPCGCGSGKPNTQPAPTTETPNMAQEAPKAAAAATPETTTATATTATATPEQPKQLTEAEWMAQAPPEIRDMVSRHKAQEAAQKATLVATLKDNGAFTEAELSAKSVDELTKLVALAGKTAQPSGVVNFAAQGTPRAEEGVPAPRDLNESIKEARSAAKE
jgi:hypothetical protein